MPCNNVSLITLLRTGSVGKCSACKLRRPVTVLTPLPTAQRPPLLRDLQKLKPPALGVGTAMQTPHLRQGVGAMAVAGTPALGVGMPQPRRRLTTPLQQQLRWLPHRLRCLLPPHETTQAATGARMSGEVGVSPTRQAVRRHRRVVPRRGVCLRAMPLQQGPPPRPPPHRLPVMLPRVQRLVGRRSGS